MSDGRCEIAETQLGRMLAAPDRRPNPLTAFRVARRWFLAGRRIEMQELAAELGVNRATLFRWVGSRDDLLGEIIWSLAEPTLTHVIEGASGHGGRRITAAAGRFATLVDQAPFFREFLRREPERALRILTTRASTVQARMARPSKPCCAKKSPTGDWTRRCLPRPGLPHRADHRVFPVRRMVIGTTRSR